MIGISFKEDVGRLKICVELDEVVEETVFHFLGKARELEIHFQFLIPEQAARILSAPIPNLKHLSLRGDALLGGEGIDEEVLQPLVDNVLSKMESIYIGCKPDHLVQLAQADWASQIQKIRDGYLDDEISFETQKALENSRLPREAVGEWLKYRAAAKNEADWVAGQCF